MSFNDENLVPLSSDLTQDEYKLEVIRGLEGLIRVDKSIEDGKSFSEGDWAVLSNADELTEAGATGVSNCYPVWCGNGDGRSDVHATGKATILMGGRFIYKTSKFVGSGFSVGDELTVKATGNPGEQLLPSAAGLGDAVVAKVHKVDAAGLMEIEVLASAYIKA